MKKFKVVTGLKCIVWIESTVIIKAKSEEEAVRKAKEMVEEGVKDGWPDDVELEDENVDYTDMEIAKSDEEEKYKYAYAWED